MDNNRNYILQYEHLIKYFSEIEMNDEQFLNPDTASQINGLYEVLESLPVFPPQKPPRSLRGTITDEGIGIAKTEKEIVEMVLPHSMMTPHPLYFGLINSSPLPGAVMGDLFVSALNNNAGAHHQSPAMATCEEEVVAFFKGLFKYSAHASGIILPGGTFANLHGILLSRTRLVGRCKEPNWLACNPRIYVSEASHFSVKRSALIAGFPEEAVISVPTRGRGAMDTSSLEKEIVADLNGGNTPCAVVATFGTTGTGAIDPVLEVVEICQRHDIWLHLDACYGGGAALLDEFSCYKQGFSHADSIAVDPHKWFFIPLTAAIALSNHPELEEKLFDLNASYIPEEANVDFWRRSMPTSRRASGFTIWSALRAHGVRTIRDAVRRNISLTRQMENQLRSIGFNVLSEGELSICCARWEPSHLSSQDLDHLQKDIAKRAVDTGKTWFSTVEHDGKIWLRINIVNLYTRARHIDTFCDLMKHMTADIGVLDG